MKTISYINGALRIIDQTALPFEEKYIDLLGVEDVAEAIAKMTVRGAPAIGAAAAAGMALAAKTSNANSPQELLERLRSAAQLLKSTRPTANNLFVGADSAFETALRIAKKGGGVKDIIDGLDSFAREWLESDSKINRTIGKLGAELIPDNCAVLTHCNAGALACVDYGTALGAIRAAVESGKKIKVFACETRPRLQGMKLTCYELMRDGIEVALIADNMAGWFMKQGKIGCAIVGADRIAANGDTANKIGTYSLAVLAKYHNIPFYIAAPTSTIDLNTPNGKVIPIEERNPEELTHINGIRVAPHGVKIENPSFDVTPAELIAAIITEKGVIKPPSAEGIKQILLET